jgi:uncharacterized protein YeaC (DUF1315 family)
MRNEFVKYITPSIKGTTAVEDWKRQLELCIHIFNQAIEHGKDPEGNPLQDLAKEDLKKVVQRYEKQLEVIEQEKDI